MRNSDSDRAYILKIRDDESEGELYWFGNLIEDRTGRCGLQMKNRLGGSLKNFKPTTELMILSGPTGVIIKLNPDTLDADSYQFRARGSWNLL
jgi:hypothetical protein